jgi:hypothetical protein
MNEPVAYINVEERKLEWAKPTTWHTPTIAQMDKIPLYTHPAKTPTLVLDGNRVYPTAKTLTDEELYEFTHRMIICSGQNPNAADINIFGLTRIVEDILKKVQEK